jgi:predicted outer membrane repeat protein
LSNNSTTTNGGGGIYNQGSTLAVTDTVFSGNTSDFGGGIATITGTTTVSNSTFFSNTARLASGGGGVYTQGSKTTLAVFNSTFDSNIAKDASSHGGGLSIAATEALPTTVAGSTFSGNSAADYGGGISSAGPLTVTNSTISGNSAVSTGGGMDVRSNATTTVINSTVSDNSASSNGGGGIYLNTGNLNLNNSLVANSTSGGDCHRASGTINAQNSLIEGELTCVNGTNTNNLTGDPLLGALADNGGSTLTMALLPGSPAIDAGDDSLCADAATVNDLDQRGVVRPQGSHCDIGAFESRGFTLAKSSGDNQSTVINTAFSAPLVVTVTSAYSEPTNGGSVAFVGPLSGAGIVPITTTTATIAGGLATANVTANGTGGAYPVSVSANGASPSQTFNLTNTYLITPTAGAHGTITPDTPQMVNHGDSITFTVAADTGYHIADIGVDGASQGAISLYTFDNVTANHTITATFATNTYTLTVATSGIGSGVVTPTIGVHTYAYGTVVTITQAADPVSYFSGWSGDCSGQGTCAVTMTEDRSVVANFDQHRIYVPLAAGGS